MHDGRDSVNLRLEGLRFSPQGIPQELRDSPHWVVFAFVPQPDGKKARKVPYTPGTDRQARVNDAETCRSYAEALVDAKRTGRLPGVRLTPESGITLIDWDGGINEELIEAFDSYTEYSVNNGMHILVAGRPPTNFVAPPGAEVYPRDGNRFLLVTGNIIAGRDTIHDRTALLAERFPPAPPAAPRPSTPLTLDDEEILRLARGARNGTKFDRLWAGDTSDYANDESRGDQALASLLTFWTQDFEQFMRLIRQSGLYDEKWDRVDYQEGTFKKAMQRLDFYSPPVPHPITPPTVTSGEDPCAPVRDELAELRAEVARLCAELAQTKRHAAERDYYEKLYLSTARVLRSDHWRPGEKMVGLSLIVELEDASRGGKVDDEGWSEVLLSRLGERAGCSAGTAGKHVDIIASTGIIETDTKPIPGKRHARRVARFPRSTGADGPTLTIADRFATLASAAPERTDDGWGGDRRCPDHPNAGTITTTTTITTCAHPGCNKVVGKPVTRRKRSQPIVTQDAALSETRPIVIENDDLRTSTVLHKGDVAIVDQDARLSEDAPAPPQEQPDRVASTLQHWPDDPIDPQDARLSRGLVPRPGGILERVRNRDMPRTGQRPLIPKPPGEPGRDAWTG
jgi:putative DNA primase/helicase